MSSKVILICSNANEALDSHPEHGMLDGGEAAAMHGGAHSDWRVKLADFTLSKHANQNNNVLQGPEPV